ncbi:RCC1 domain-containing protein, partial [Bifidobacterium sp. H6bp9]|uniref:RCC1 domain-containing protein n=1 Tax=Bifidobacterium sp. H6bp9 TaxID=3051961 RepID=UPI0028BEECE7
LALGSDGNIYAWGSNSNGQLGDGTTTQKTIPVKVKPPVGKPTAFTYVQVIRTSKSGRAAYQSPRPRPIQGEQGGKVSL